MNNNKFTEWISSEKLRNEIHKTYLKEVKPFLEANRKAYKNNLESNK